MLHTSPESNRPKQFVSQKVPFKCCKEGTFYFGEQDSTFFRLNWGCIECSRILKDLSLIEVKKCAAVLVLFVKIHHAGGGDKAGVQRTKKERLSLRIWRRVSVAMSAD
jgi:hypothetical protein